MDLNKDYYRILGLPKNANLRQIKLAYRNLALKFHPDRAPDDLKEQAEILFKEISEAYEILSNRQKKAIYDLQYKNEINQQDKESSIVKRSDNDNFQTTTDRILDKLNLSEVKYFFTKGKIAALILFSFYLLFLIPWNPRAAGRMFVGEIFFLSMILFGTVKSALIGWMGMIMLGWFVFIISLSNY